MNVLFGTLLCLQVWLSLFCLCFFAPLFIGLPYFPVSFLLLISDSLFLLLSVLFPHSCCLLLHFLIFLNLRCTSAFLFLSVCFRGCTRVLTLLQLAGHLVTPIRIGVSKYQTCFSADID